MRVSGQETRNGRESGLAMFKMTRDNFSHYLLRENGITKMRGAVPWKSLDFGDARSKALDEYYDSPIMIIAVHSHATTMNGRSHEHQERVAGVVRRNRVAMADRPSVQAHRRSTAA